MTKYGKETNPKSESGRREKKNGGLYPLMEERNKLTKGMGNGRRGRNDQKG